MSAEAAWSAITGNTSVAGIADPKKSAATASRASPGMRRLKEWIARTPDITLEELQGLCRDKLDVRIGINALWHRLDKLGLGYKKTARASEQDRPDVRATRKLWRKRQGRLPGITPVLETYHNAQGRKRTVLRMELLQNINLGETSIFRCLRGYLETALWASNDEDGNPIDRDFTISNLSTEAILSAWAECSRFIRECETDLAHLDDDRAGHNFWLTRNSHGLGFFDEKVDDESAEIAMQQLTRASEAFGEVDLYLGDDRKLHCYDALEVKREDLPLVFVFVGWFLIPVRCLFVKKAHSLNACLAHIVSCVRD